MVLKKLLKEYTLITIGCIMLAIGINVFYLPNNLVTGGFSGLSIIITRYSSDYLGISFPIWILNLCLNLPLFVVSFIFLSKKVVAKSLFATVMLSAALYVTGFITFTENDLFLTAIFGGVICGLGLGIVFRYSATTGGTDLVATLLHKYWFRSTNISTILFVIDTSILILGLFAFGASHSMYAIIAVFVTSKSIDVMLEGVGFAKVVFIISNKYNEISQQIIVELGRGVTGLSSIGMYSESEKLTLMTVIPKNEVQKLKDITKLLDANAFIIVADVREVLGEGFNK